MSDPAMVRRLLAILDRASDDQWQRGTYWYAAAHDQCVALAAAYSVSVECAAGVVAALSPQKSWDVNVAMAWRFFETGRGGQTAANEAKARAIRFGADPRRVLGGSKCKAFYACIMSPLADAVAVDRHALAAALGTRPLDDREKKWLERAGSYDLVADAYRAAARRRGIAVAQCQAIVWVVWRDEHGVTERVA